MTITPLIDFERRVPEAGRIRLGVKTARAMKSIDTFRFTSPHQDLIYQLSEMYGGNVQPWNDDRAKIQNQWEVQTTSSEINIYLPQDGLSQSYELWTGGGRERCCTGVDCQLMGHEGPEITSCICAAKKVAECKLYTRLNVILPELPFRGVWRMETKGWNAGHEMPGMFDLIQTLHSSGNLVQSRLALEHRSDTKNGRKRHYVVPVVSIAQSPMAILAGEAQVQALKAEGSHRLELTAAESNNNHDEIIYDAEVFDTELAAEIEDLLRSDAIQFALDPDRYVQAVRLQANNDLDSMRRAHEKVVANKIEPLKFKRNGLIEWLIME